MDSPRTADAGQEAAAQISVRRATPEDAEAAAAVMALAFTDDPWTRAHAAGGDDLTKRLNEHYRLLLEEDWLQRAEVDVAVLSGRQGQQAPELLGVAIWDRPVDPEAPSPARNDVQERAEAILGVDPEIEAQDHRDLDRLHPREPHWRLAMLTVAPAAQGRRVGSTLLEHGLARAEGLPAVLEATTPGSRRLYERSGFELVELMTDALGVEQAVMRRG
ncbi:GNAT family N-acetyltransferase [Kocuria palustris]|uniref:GNAT family N-acetyltransferase n=1 Tax=Kocuria palustris TaxID=71999 RepID=UPI0011A97F5C|nr:GNAT family N-acetyltransferase [Kocuria palustris]